MSKETKNVNELTPEQEMLVARAQELLVVLNKEPAVELSPFLRFTEAGIRPDVRLVVKKAKDESVTGDEGVVAEEAGASEEPAGGEQPAEAPVTAG